MKARSVLCVTCDRWIHCSRGVRVIMVLHVFKILPAVGMKEVLGRQLVKKKGYVMEWMQ